MAKNPHSHHELDSTQIDKRVFDPTFDALRFVLADAHAMSISLSAASGDNVTALPNSLCAKVSIDPTLSGDVLSPVSVVGMKTFSMSINTTSDATGPCNVTVMMSPSDTDNVWYPLFSVSPSPTNQVVLSSTPVAGLGRRIKVTLSSPLTTGSFDLYVLAQSV